MAVSAADLDGDGLPDVLSASVLDNKVAWYENLGGGGLGPQQVISTAEQLPVSVHAADLNNDTLPDVLAASWGDNTIVWYRNLGGGNFSERLEIDPEAWGAWGFHAADMDGDGDQDVVSAACGVSWYENLTSMEVDDDSDGYAECAGDCDDANPGAAQPGAPEINDGLDNQWPGETGYGLADEIAGVCGFHNAGDKGELSWTAQAGAMSYEVARCADPQFSSGCTQESTSATYWSDGDAVPQGVCHHYLVRALTPYVGSWGSGSSGERTGICP